MNGWVGHKLKVDDALKPRKETTEERWEQASKLAMLSAVGRIIEFA